MKSIDIKIDDGKANSGNVLGGSLKTSVIWGNAGIHKDPMPNCSSGVDYIVTNRSYECTPLIRIGAQSGNLQ